MKLGITEIFGLSLLLVGTVFAKCDKNIINDLSFKLSGSNLAFPCDSTKNIYLSTGRYISRNVLATRIQIYNDLAIVAIPRLKQGIPFTLASFSLKSKESKVFLQPFPCWSLQEEGNCEALQSVIDIYLDQSDILWALDSGIVNTLEQPIRRCSPKVVGINAKTGQVVQNIDLTNFITPGSRLQYLVCDYSSDGTPFIYISDSGSGAIIVYDVIQGKGYRVVLPKAVANTNKDVLYIALVRRSTGNALYFTYLSSPRLFYISCDNLQKGQASGAIVDVGPKPAGSSIVILGTDNGAALFFRNKGESDVYIWNTDTCFKNDNFLLVQTGDECRLSTQVVPGYKRLMWVIESNFQDYFSNTAGCLGASIFVHPLVKTCEQ